MGRPMNYNGFSATYAETRWAMPWIVSALSLTISELPEGSIIVDVGCGTGDYVVALSKKYHNHAYFGFDLSEKMLDIAKSRSKKIDFSPGDADRRFPYPDSFANMLFCVDVIHHLSNLPVFFTESYRVLKNDGMLIIVTDSEEDIRGRSLSKYFPEVLSVELERYPAIKELFHHAHSAGFRESYRSQTSGYINIEDEFIEKLQNKCSSALRLISHEAHRRGIERLKQAKRKAEKWLSRYTVIQFKK